MVTLGLSHPAGPEYIDNYAGDDGTEEFLESHPLDIIERTITGKVQRARETLSDPGFFHTTHSISLGGPRRCHRGAHRQVLPPTQPR